MARKAPRITLTDPLIDALCERVASGQSAKTICAQPGMPSESTLYRWLSESEQDGATDIYRRFRERYARAREAQADALAEEMLDVARAATEKNAASKRLLVDVLKWRAGKLRPKVYGDKVDLNHGVQPDDPLAAVMRRAAMQPLIPGGDE